MLASTMGGRLRVWDTASRTHADLGKPGDDAMLLFSPGNRLLADAGRFRLRLWDSATRVVAAGPRIKGAEDSIQDAVFSPDGRLIATAAAGCGPRRADSRTPRQLHDDLAVLLGRRKYQLPVGTDVANASRIVGPVGDDRDPAVVHSVFL
jgi:hypothetical protein